MFRRLSFVVVATALAVAGALAAFGAAKDDALPTPPPGFKVTVIARLDEPRELAAAPNGDLIVGTSGRDVDVVADAEGHPAPPRVLASIDDEPSAGVALHHDTLYIGSQFGIWRVAYDATRHAASANAVEIAHLRPSGAARDHTTTTVAVSGDRLFAGVGSSCDACDPDLDATRATVQELALDGSGMHPKAIRIRNPIALAVDPQSGAVWAGVAGQDELEHGHPYEIFDPITAHAGTVDYGWPHCYEDHRPVEPGRDCSHQTPPRVVFPAYETPIGATFYLPGTNAPYAFGAHYAQGAFVTLHGSWHSPPVPPRVVFVPLEGDRPKTPVDWSNPNAQWREFLGGFQLPSGVRIGRPTGIAVGPQGSLFVADDKAGVIYRIRPVRPQ